MPYLGKKLRKIPRKFRECGNRAPPEPQLCTTFACLRHRSPDPLADFRGPLCGRGKGKEGKEGGGGERGREVLEIEKREGRVEGRDGKEKEEGKRGKGEFASLALGG